MIDATKLQELQNTLVEAEAVAKQIVADPHHTKSQFVAGLRGGLTQAMGHLAEHKLWLVKNPVPAAVPPDTNAPTAPVAE